MIESWTAVNDIHGWTASNPTNECRTCQRIDDRAVLGRKGVHGRPSTRIYREVSPAEVETCLCRHFRDKFARVNELVAKPRMNFRIEYLLEPIDGQGTARRLTRIRVIGK